jgi:hypothetical protein
LSDIVPETIEFPDEGPMLQAVGKGLTAFASLELGVGICFAAMLDPAPRLRSVTVINAARSFDAKMKMVDALAAVALEGEHFATWRNLSCRITKRKDVRDKLAHWMVSLYPGASSVEELKKMKRALVPPAWSKAHMEVMWDPLTNRKAKPLFLSQLDEFAAKTSELAAELLQFSNVVGKPRGGAQNP